MSKHNLPKQNFLTYLFGHSLLQKLTKNALKNNQKFLSNSIIPLKMTTFLLLGTQLCIR